MNEPKPWWASKTMWANIIAAVAAMSLAMGLDLGLDGETQATLLAGVMAFANLFLRAVTKQPVSIK